VKGNQEALYEELSSRFLEYGEHDYCVPGLRKHVTVEKSHGRRERREYFREVHEETGVVARWICLVGRVQFEHNAKQVDVKYYLMEYMYQDERKEKRRVQWLNYDAASESLTHEQNKALLKQAERIRRQRLHQSKSAGSEQG
jgi:hypothetical protein